MYIHKNLITDAEGNFVFSVLQDNTEHAKNVKEEREYTGGWTEERTMKKMLSIPPYVYYAFADKLGPDCWADKNFLEFFKKNYPHYSM